MDIKSIMGYANNSPFRNNPYLDINTPEGVISMEDTPIDLLGIDNLGNIKEMKANSKNPYQFEGDVVREIPINNPYLQQGGITQQLLSYLFDDDEEDAPIQQSRPIEQEEELSLDKNERLLRERQEEELAMEQAMLPTYDNPYRTQQIEEFQGDGLDFDEEDTMYDPNTYSGQLSSGKWGAKNVGKYGQKIVNEVSSALGYVPQFNSIYRDKTQQAQLIKKGVGAPNSWHLTGDAVDMKPADWNNLPDDKKQYFRSNYDVIFHNNHYHIEPKG